MIAGLLGLVSGGACHHGYIQASALQGSHSIRDGHIYVIYIVNAHIRGGQVSGQQLVKVRSHRSADGLSGQAFRGGQGFILGIQAECLGGAAVHVYDLNIGSIGSGQDDGASSYCIENLYVSGCQSLCLIGAGSDLCIFHIDSQLTEGIGEDSLAALNNAGHI